MTDIEEQADKYTVDIFEQWKKHKPKKMPLWSFDQNGNLIMIDDIEVISDVNIFNRKQNE